MSARTSPSPWSPLALEEGVSIEGFQCDVFRWHDARQRPRSAAMVHNDARDPAGFFGGYLRRFTYEKSDGSTLVAVGGAQHPGWGYTLHHREGLPDRETLSSRRAPGSFRCVFLGRHHALYEYAWTVLRTQGDDATGAEDWPIAVTIRWLFANGLDGPVWAHTIQLAGLAADAIHADDRSPAGELCFDGANGIVSGAGWGDRYRFATTSAPLSMHSRWDYSQENRVPYVRLWSDSADAELGAVQTWDIEHRDAGYGWFFRSWGSTSDETQSMPVDWNWTYQLNQYELTDAGTTSKRLNWGTNFGSVGQRSYPAYGDSHSLCGYPVVSRSTRLVLGTKGATLAEAERISASLDVTLTAIVGTVSTAVAKGFGPPPLPLEELAPAGWNHVYGVFELVAAEGIHVRIVPGERELQRAVFRIREWHRPMPTTIKLGDAELVPDIDVLLSLVTNDGEPELWLTFVQAIEGITELVVG